MPDVELLAILAATVAAFLSAAVYYGALGNQLASVSEAAAAAGPPAPWELGVELLRCLLLATVVAGLAAQGGIDEWTGGLALGLALWVGFPLVLWVGAIVHEHTPVKLAALHGGDWLVKLLLVSVVVSVLQ